MTILFVATFGIFLVILIYVIFKNYWKLERKINCEFLGPFTPDYFGFSETQKFKDEVRIGTEIARNSSIVICGLIRDHEESVKNIKARVMLLKRFFRSVKVLIVENDSDDNTRKKLLEWACEDPRTVEILGCGINAPKCTMKLEKTDGHKVTSKRLEKMALLRNIYRNRVSQAYSNYDYILVWDMDILGSLYMDGILSSISKFCKNNLGSQEIKPDGICAKGLYIWPGLKLYYDTFAHTDSNLDWSLVLPEKFQHVIKTFSAQYMPTNFKKVTSCFSGATIYKISSFLKNRYVVKDKECEHDSISKGLNMYVNANMINYVLLNT